jgi:hypothetical protein
VTWFWPGRLALGKLAILEGDPGLGKSLFALDLCARLSTGRPLPDGSIGPGTGQAVLLNGEDGPEDTVRPRLEALGADLDRVFLPQFDGTPLLLPRHADLLDAVLEKTYAQLVVIDPILAFLEPQVLSGNDPSVRAALAPLERLAERHRCTVLLIRHLTKRGGRQPLYRGVGSIGFLAVCRSGWLIARDPEQPQQCILAEVKNNLGPPQPSLAYTVETSDQGPVKLTWLGPSARTAAELQVTAVRRPPFLSQRLCGRDVLAEILEDGPRTSREVWAEAQQRGLSERTLWRAKQELAVRSVRITVGGLPLSYWLLPGQELPDRVRSDDLEPWLRPLREKYPPSTPIDEY